MLEVDAKLTEDGVPVAVHDATLDRTTNCSGEVRTFTYLELDGCRTDVLGSPGSPLPTRPARRTEPIPRIADVLELARQTGAEVNLEIKNVPTDPDYDTTPAFANRVMDAVLASGVPRRAADRPELHPGDLDVARQRLPGVRTSLLSVQSLTASSRSPPTPTTTSSPPSGPLRPTTSAARTACGLDVAPFTLDAAADVRAARRAGVDAVITDDALMAGRALGMRPARALHRRGVHPGAAADRDGRPADAARRVRAPGVPRHGDDARDDRRPPDAHRARTAEPQLRVPLRHPADAAAAGSADVTIRFDGNARVLPQLDGPSRAGLAPPVFRP